MTNDVTKILVDAIEGAGKRYSLKRRSIVTDCPACGKEEKLYILRESGGSKCFRCGKTWGITGIVYALTGREMIREIQTGAELDLKFSEFESLNELSDADFEDAAPTEKEFVFDPSFISAHESTRAIEYLVNRGATNPEIWVRHGLLYQAGLDAIVAPVVVKGVTLGYQARFIAPKYPNFRMKSSDGLPRERALYNYDNAVQKDSLLIVEGIFDCVNGDVLPEVGAVATMGKIVSEGQIDLIKKGPWKKVYIGLDRDAAEQVRSVEETLCDGTREVFRVFPPQSKKDFGECSPEDVREAIALAAPSTKEKLGRLELFFRR